MRVLVTGVTGQIGGALVSRLAGSVAVISANRQTLDLAAPAQIVSRLDAINPDLIINPAAYTAVDLAEDERDLAFLVNAESPGAMARWAAPRNVPLVQLSTDYVFDGSGERPWRETDAPNPLSAYGESKLAGETAVREAGGPHLVVRTSWVYAATGKNFLRTMARLAAEREELRVVADQVGAPTSAALIADALATIVVNHARELPQRFAAAEGLVHLAAAGVTSWHGFATAIVDGLRARNVVLRTQRIIPIRADEYPTRAKRPLNSRLDLSRIGRIFGLSPPNWAVVLEPELDPVAAGV